LVNLWEMMKAFQAHTLLNTVRNLHNVAGLVFESKRGPEYRLEAIKYTDEEAETIMINVRSLMEKLATRLHE